MTAVIESAPVSDVVPRQSRTKGFVEHFRARTPEAQAAAFAYYLEQSEPYFDAVRDRGGEPWFHTEDERRVLFFARYDRPQPPAGLPRITSLRDFHNRNNH